MKISFPFILSAVLWLFLSALFILFSARPDWVNYMQNLAILTAIWFLSLLNLFSLAKTVASMSHSLDNGKKTAFWGFAKFISLGFLVGMIYVGKSKSMPTTLVLGISTCLVVPVLGGLFWNKKEFSNAR